MRKVWMGLGAWVLASGMTLGAADLSPRFGVTGFGAAPADTAGKIYGSGWKVALAVHVRRESEVEGRVRMEFGSFSEGSAVFRAPYENLRYSARTRLVGYDWLVPLGGKREQGVDFIVGIGGAHWFRERRRTTVPGTPYPVSDSSTDYELAFAGTLGFRFRASRQVCLEVHHVLTSLPGRSRDFEDAQLSHTALGVGVRF